MLINTSENFVGATKFYLTAIEGLDNDDVRLSKRKGLSSRRLRGFERNKVGPVDRVITSVEIMLITKFRKTYLIYSPENTKTMLVYF